jgi:hypothetical protein
VFLVHSIVADAQDAAVFIAFAKHAHEACQIKLLIFAAQADPRDLDR